MKFLLLRTAFFLLSSFTFLNSVKILNIPLHFPWLVLFATSFGIWMFWEIICRRYLYFPRAMAGLFVFHLYADILGNTFKLYAKFIRYDEFTHLTGGLTLGVLMILILSYLNKKKQWKLTSKPLIFFSASLSLSLGVLYEFWEYFAQSVLGYQQLIGGIEDIIDDLFLDLISAAIAASLLVFLLKKKGYFVPPHQSLDDQMKS